MRNYKTPKKYSRPRKYHGKCEHCGEKCDNPQQYVDGDNIAITYYAPYLCPKCYEKYIKAEGRE